MLDPDGVQAAPPSRPATRRPLGITVSELPSSSFHLFGFADFVVAIGTGPTLFLQNDPLMAGIQTLPMALIPFFGVGVSGASHLMAFDLLRRGAGEGRR